MFTIVASLKTEILKIVAVSMCRCRLITLIPLDTRPLQSVSAVPSLVILLSCHSLQHIIAALNIPRCLSEQLMKWLWYRGRPSFISPHERHYPSAVELPFALETRWKELEAICDSHIHSSCPLSVENTIGQFSPHGQILCCDLSFPPQPNQKLFALIEEKYLLDPPSSSSRIPWFVLCLRQGPHIRLLLVLQVLPVRTQVLYQCIWSVRVLRDRERYFNHLLLPWLMQTCADQHKSANRSCHSCAKYQHLPNSFPVLENLHMWFVKAQLNLKTWAPLMLRSITILAPRFPHYLWLAFQVVPHYISKGSKS